MVATRIISRALPIWAGPPPGGALGRARTLGPGLGLGVGSAAAAASLPCRAGLRRWERDSWSCGASMSINDPTSPASMRGGQASVQTRTDRIPGPVRPRQVQRVPCAGRIAGTPAQSHYTCAASLPTHPGALSTPGTGSLERKWAIPAWRSTGAWPFRFANNVPFRPGGVLFTMRAGLLCFLGFRPERTIEPGTHAGDPVRSPARIT